MNTENKGMNLKNNVRLIARFFKAVRSKDPKMLAVAGMATLTAIAGYVARDAEITALCALAAILTSYWGISDGIAHFRATEKASKLGRRNVSAQSYEGPVNTL